MGMINLKDTGYANIASDGLVESFVVNDGTAVELYSVNLAYQRGTGVDNSPVPGLYEDSKLNFVSVSNPVITMRGILDRDKQTDIIHTLKYLDEMTTSKGVKCLYYDGSGDDWHDLLDGLGTKESSIPTGHYTGTHAHVKCTGFTANEGASSNLIRYTVTCEVTN